MSKKRKFNKKVQKEFVDGVVQGIPPSKVCQEIFAEKNLKPETASKYAVKLFSRREVERDIRSILLESGMSREGLAHELAKLIVKAKKESNKLKAIEMAFRLHGDLGLKMIARKL